MRGSCSREKKDEHSHGEENLRSRDLSAHKITS